MPCVIHSPDSDGLPSAFFGAGADRFGLPSGSRGMPGVGYLIHCAATGTAVATNTAAIAARERPIIPASLPDPTIEQATKTRKHEEDLFWFSSCLRLFLRLLPGASDRLPEQERGIRARARLVLLCAAVVHFGHVEVAVLIDAHAVHAPHAAGEIAPRAPRILEVSVEVVFQDPVGAAIGGPEEAVGGDDEHVDVGRVGPKAPLAQEFAVLVE